ncbi:hypothetical protein, partial [Halomonas sp. SpR8]|uniref:hypothetical protein n=1 Tax=Halomonas sp. SpR8 TaxID=3050463 RepID=UPI0027E3E8AF
WVSCRYPMLCFTLVGKAERVPALALLPLPNDPKCCGYSMNPGLKTQYASLFKEAFFYSSLFLNKLFIYPSLLAIVIFSPYDILFLIAAISIWEI